MKVAASPQSMTRSQLFWHSLSHIRRFLPLRMTKCAVPFPLNPEPRTLNPEPNESKVKRGCEEMRIHFFTAPSHTV